jgi:hypothetical protein
MTPRRAQDICRTLGCGDPQTLVSLAEKGMSLDEIIRRVARDEAGRIKASAAREVTRLEDRVSDYLARKDVREEVDRETLSYFRHPNYPPSGKRAGRAGQRR